MRKTRPGQNNTLLSILAAACCIIGTVGPASADQVFLKNGDRISGRATDINNSQALIFESAFGARMAIPWRNVVAVYDDQGQPMRTENVPLLTAPAPGPAGLPRQQVETVEVVRAVPAEPTQIVDNSPAADIAEEDKKEGFKWSGRANLGGNLQDGNTNKKSVNFDAAVKARDEKNRFRFGGDAMWASDEGVETDNEQSLYGEYDRFLTEKWFVGARQSFKIDKIAELDLRSRSNLSVGRQFYERDTLNLQAELGGEYIQESFSDGTEENDIAARWGLDYDQKFFEERLQVFHKHNFSLPVSDSSAFLFESESGLRIPLGYGIIGTGQIDFDWDNDPAEGVRAEDTTYSAKLGYEW